MSKYYLAYGSNLNIAQMAFRCPTAKRVGRTYIKDYELKYCGTRAGYLTILPAANKEVPLGVWLIEDEDEKRLDMYEGYPTHYRKEIIPITIKGEVHEAIIYIMNCTTYKKPSDQYVKTCTRGYEDFEFDKSYLIRASLNQED